MILIKKILPRLFLLVIGLYLFLPLFATGIYAFSKSWTSLLPSGFTLKFFLHIFADSQLKDAFLRSIVVSILPVSLTVFVVLLAVYTCMIYEPRLEKYVQIVCMMPYTLQGIILAVSVLSFYSGKRGFLSDRMVMLIGIYCICILPFIYQGIRNALNTIPVHALLEAAELLGSNKLFAFFRIIVPSMLSGIVITAMVSMGIIFGDYVVIKMIASSQFTTLMILLNNSRTKAGQETSAMVILIFATTLLLSFTAFWLKNRESKRKFQLESMEE